MAAVEHTKEYAKAYTAAVGAVVSPAISEHATNIIMWFISMTGLQPPDGVNTSMRYLITAAIAGLAVKYISNTPRS